MPRGVLRNRRSQEDSRILREYTNYVRANQRLHTQLLESIISNEQHMFSLLNQSNSVSPSFGTNAFASPMPDQPFTTEETWSLFSTPPLMQRRPLTLTEIDLSTEYRTYGSIPSEQQRYPTCPITMNSFEDNTIVMQIRECGHYFTPHSLRTHLSTQDTCPYCRHNIRASLLEVIGNGLGTSSAPGNTADASGNATGASGAAIDTTDLPTDATGRTRDASDNTAINNLNASVFYHIANNRHSLS